MAQKNSKLIIDEQSKEYWRWRDSILTYEEVMLEMLTFDLMVDNPYARLHGYMAQLDLLPNKTLRDSALAFINDACLTVLPLLLNARDVAIAAIFFATCVTRHKIDDVAGEPWWAHLRGSETHTVRAVQLMTDFYRENPLRRPDARGGGGGVPGSPEFTLESTRRRGELGLSSQMMDPDSSQYGTPATPLGTDRAPTLSPSHGAAASRAHVNGREERETSGDGRDQQGHVAIKREDEADRGDSDAALKLAANDLAMHEGSNGTGHALVNGAGLSAGGLVSPQINPGGGLVSPQINAGGGLVSPQINPGGGLVSPHIKRSPEAGEGEGRTPKRPRLEEGEEDEGEIRWH